MARNTFDLDDLNDPPPDDPGSGQLMGTGPGTRLAAARTLLSKVPEITVYFWVIKVLCTTVGETAADFLDENLGLGLSGTSLVMGLLLAVALVLQFRTRSYTAGVYWLTVVLISVVGTLVSDYLVDERGVSLEVTTIAFAVLLAITFGAWFAAERSLSIHTIVTPRREAYYWLAILFTFALGTSAGDLVAESLALGYGWSVVVFAAAIALVAVAGTTGLLGAVTAFWVAYVLTRPLGASLGDLLSQDRSDGGLGLGTVVTSGVFLAAILALVAYLVASRVDVPGTGRATGGVGRDRPTGTGR